MLNLKKSSAFTTWSKNMKAEIEREAAEELRKQTLARMSEQQKSAAQAVLRTLNRLVHGQLFGWSA